MHPTLRPFVRRLALSALAVAVLGPAAFGAAVPVNPYARPLREAPAMREDLGTAMQATLDAQAEIGRDAFEGTRSLLGILASDVRNFGRFFTRRLTLSAKLGDNPFFVAHKVAAIVGPRADEPWDLTWALPEELKAPGAWRAAVAGLPPASIRGTRAQPEHGLQFVDWPPILAE